MIVERTDFVSVPVTDLASIAGRLPKFGVTAFCPTTVACSPADLRNVLGQVRQAREVPDQRAARASY
jgi:N-acetylglucosamine-6-phosphate deacetylase